MLTGCRPATVSLPEVKQPIVVTPPIQEPSVSTPVPVKPIEKVKKVDRPSAVTWINGRLSEVIGALEMWPPYIMPGESVKFEFESEYDQAEVESLLTQKIGDSTQYQLEWLDNKTVLFTLIDSSKGLLLFGPFESTSYFYFPCYEVVSAQKLVVLGQDYAPIFSVDIPISTRGAISMSPDYRQVRLARQVNLDWLHLGIQEYVFDINTLRIDKGKLHSYRVGGVDYLLLDWIEHTLAATPPAKYNAHFPAGISNNGMMLANYETGKIRITDLLTKQSQAFPVGSVQHAEFDFPNPQRVFWSHDDKLLFYTASTPDDHANRLYNFDIATGLETMILIGHEIRSASPYTNHMFTNAWDSGSAYYIVDERGNTLRISEPNESVVLTKWIDKDRLLVNKSTETIYSGFFFNSQCYIYHLNENRWEYICEGYGFDYDTATGRVFVLQNR